MHGYDLPNASPTEREQWFATTRGAIEDLPEPQRGVLGAMLDAIEALYGQVEELDARPGVVYVPVRAGFDPARPF